MYSGKQIDYFIDIFEYEVDFLFATIGLFEVNNELARSQIVQHFELACDETFAILFETLYGNELLSFLELWNADEKME